MGPVARLAAGGIEDFGAHTVSFEVRALFFLLFPGTEFVGDSGVGEAVGE